MRQKRGHQLLDPVPGQKVFKLETLEMKSWFGHEIIWSLANQSDRRFLTFDA